MKGKPKVPYGTMFPEASEQALDLLELILVFDPPKRISVTDAYNHPYFSALRSSEDGRRCLPMASNLSFEFEYPPMQRLELKQLILHEVDSFRIEQQRKDRERERILNRGIRAQEMYLRNSTSMNHPKGANMCGETNRGNGTFNRACSEPVMSRHGSEKTYNHNLENGQPQRTIGQRFTSSNNQFCDNRYERVVESGEQGTYVEGVFAGGRAPAAGNPIIGRNLNNLYYRSRSPLFKQQAVWSNEGISDNNESHYEDQSEGTTVINGT